MYFSLVCVRPSLREARWSSPVLKELRSKDDERPVVYATYLKRKYNFALIWLAGDADQFRDKLLPDLFEHQIIFAAVE